MQRIKLPTVHVAVTYAIPENILRLTNFQSFRKKPSLTNVAPVMKF